MSSNRIFQNYHCHKEYTNVRISDSAATLKEYAARARELGHGILSSCEHGWQGNYYQTVKLAREFGLKPLICAEAYWVKDREEKDRSNCHIFIAAMNENGRQALNDVLSEANITGFYGQPRLDIPLILSLPKDDVVVTTACVAYWRYDDIEEITKQFAEHFGKNFFLEVQYHNTESQRELNRYILELHKKYNIPIIMGCDSHYIFPDQAQTRADFLASKGLTYENEDDWYLDYPDGETAYKRFAEQCVLSDEEICEAMENTNVFLNVEEYNSPVFNEKIKLPTLYPELSQDERNEIYKKLVWDNWAEYKKEVPENQWSHYEDEINKEIQTVVDTRMADYFIDNYYIIKKGKENGGWLTKTGRGCFTKDAIIETENGPKPINEVTTADWVMTHTGDMMPVYKTMRYSVDERLAVVTPVEIYGAGGNGAEEGPLPAPVTCTLDHKFFVKTRYFVDEYGWKKACELKPRDLICIPLGNGIYDYVKVKVSITEPIRTDVYDLGVLGNHSYTVNGIAVHNSGVSFITNKLLGFTEVDRVSAKVHMYPERFMSATRILESGSLPDIDHNCAPVEPFARAQKEILGEDHSYPMIAYGTMQKSAAWKLYAKSQGINFEIANAVSSQIRNYEFAVKHLNEEEAESVDIKDYIDEEFHEVYEKSKDYLGLVTSWSIAPCSYLLYSGSIRKEIGLVKVKDNLCCIMDGHWAEECHFLKNDLLKVSVVDLICRAYHRIGMEPPSVPELLKMCGPNDPAWDIYARSCTLGINQCEQKGTSARVAKYKPKNISELAAFVAAIRPGFKSMYKTFESRQHFDYGVKAFDDLIQTEEMPDSFLLYQEQEMAALNYAGIEMSECYTAIKNIAKKRAEKVISYKNKFIRGFQRAIMEQEGKSQNDARAVAVKLWKIIEDSANYSFNASHSYCVALDSLYCAWLKAHHPLEFYETLLKISEEKNDKDKMYEIREEANDYFGISFPSFKFGQDNREIKADLETNSITNAITSIKGFSQRVADVLYECGQQNFEHFTDVLKYLFARSIKVAKVAPLISINYFSDYGNIPTLSAILRAFIILKEGNAKIIKKENVPDEMLFRVFEWACDSNDWAFKVNGQADLILTEYEEYLRKKPKPDAPLKTKIRYSLDVLGYADVVTGKPEDRKRLFIKDVTPLKSSKGDVWAYRVSTKSVGTGKEARITIKAVTYEKNPIKEGDIIKNPDVWRNPAGYWYLFDYEKEGDFEN